MLNEYTIRQLRRVAKLHTDWLILVLLGPELLTAEEQTDLVVYGKLPTDQELDLVTTAYFLGKQYSRTKRAEYSQLSVVEYSALSDLERDSIMKLRLHGLVEIRHISESIFDSLISKLHNNYDAGIDDAVELLVNETLSKFYDIFKDLFSLSATDMLNVSKNQAIMDSISNKEFLYTEGLDTRLLVKHKDMEAKVVASDLVSKALSFFNMDPIPAGADYVEGKLVVVDEHKMAESLAKARAGVSGGISSTVMPKGPPQPKTPGSPASVPGVPAPGNTPGPGRPAEAGGAKPQAAGAGPNVLYRYVKPDKATDADRKNMVDTTSTGHLKVPVGAGGEPMSQSDIDPATKTAQAKAWGKEKKPTSEVMHHLTQGTIATVKPLSSRGHSQGQSSFRVTIEGNGRGLMKTPNSHMTEASHKNYFGAGFGSVQKGTEPTREVAAHKLSGLMGLDHVPPTTTRSYKGEQHSMQAWQEDHVTPEGMDFLSKTEGTDQFLENPTDAILKQVPEEHRDKFKNKLHELITMDIVMNNNDRHINNIVVNKDATDFKAIDHGDSFGTGMKGHRNDFHFDFHRMGQSVTIPEKLKQNLETKSLGDYRRALGDHLPDWEVGQTFLRGQYALHLQNTEGHLDYEKFKPTVDSFTGEHHSPLLSPSTDDSGHNTWETSKEWRVQGSAEKGMDEFKRREATGLLPHQMFESWAKNFINEHKNNPESKHHSAAKELDQIGVFMGPGSTMDPRKYRAEGKHLTYANSISAGNPPAKVSTTKGVTPPKTTREDKGKLGDALKEIGEAGTLVARGKDRRQKAGLGPGGVERRKGPRRSGA